MDNTTGESVTPSSDDPMASTENVEGVPVNPQSQEPASQPAAPIQEAQVPCKRAHEDSTKGIEKKGSPTHVASAAKRPNFSLGSNFWKGSEQDEDPNHPMAKKFHTPFPVSDAAKLAALKAFRLAMNVGSADSRNTQTPPAFPWPHPDIIKVTEDTSLLNLDVVGDGIVIQFEDCYKALQSLCSCSLQKVGSHEIADYTVMWKDQGVCFDASQNASSVSERIMMI